MGIRKCTQKTHSGKQPSYLFQVKSACLVYFFDIVDILHTIRLFSLKEVSNTILVSFISTFHGLKLNPGSLYDRGKL